MPRIGDVVASDVHKIFADRFRSARRQENAAHRMLEKAMEEYQRVWEDLDEEFCLDREAYNYKFDEKKREIVVSGYNKYFGE